MITRERYLEALELIDQYHLQRKTNPLKVEIFEWFARKGSEASVRLRNALIPYNYGIDELPFKYIEDVNKREFMKLRNTGKKSWAEFVRLRRILR